MRVRLLPVLFLALCASACGGALATPPGSDGGAIQPASTSTGSGTTETATDTSSATVTYTNVSDMTVIETGTETNMSTASCTISASNYDQSCALDLDCILVKTGNWCGTGCLCTTAPINDSAAAAFFGATAVTPVGSGAVPVPDCACPAETAPCCRQGQCTTDCQ